MLATIQDLGRTGSRRFGINPNGAMDPLAVRAINIALGNDENTSVLEMHFPAPEIEFAADTTFGIAGADFGCVINGEPVQNGSARNAAKGSILKFTRKFAGNRAYLAVKGGFSVAAWLGSHSTNVAAHAGGLHGRPLAAGDVLECKAVRDGSELVLGPSFANHVEGSHRLRVIPSGEFDLLTALSEQVFLSEQFTLSPDSNRMGFRLKGPPLHLLENRSLLSSATSFGTIQLLPDGQMIILMADHQTTGGYPRIGNVISADLPIAGQLGAGDRIGFEVVSIAEAEQAAIDVERDLRFFKMGVRLRRGTAF